MKIELNIETPKDLKELRAKAPELTDIALEMIDRCPFDMPRLVSMETTVSSPIDFDWESVPVLSQVDYKTDGRVGTILISFVDEEAIKKGLLGGDPIYTVNMIPEFSDDDFDTTPFPDITIDEFENGNYAKFVRNDETGSVERVEIPFSYYERGVVARKFCDVLLQYLCRDDEDKTLLHSNLLHFFTQGLRYITEKDCQNSKAFQAISDAWTEVLIAEINDIPVGEFINSDEVLNNDQWKIPNSGFKAFED